VNEAPVLEPRPGSKRSAPAGEGHPGALIELAGGRVLPGGPDADAPVAQRAGDVEQMKDKGETNSCALLDGTHEHHREVQERGIGLADAVVEPSGLGQRHAHDARSQRYERQGI